MRHTKNGNRRQSQNGAHNHDRPFCCIGYQQGRDRPEAFDLILKSPGVDKFACET